ncbi:MAG: FUSC family protein, partial [Daejeonella sp.]|nr:FUSC family protein [Daejeonella sp.]
LIANYQYLQKVAIILSGSTVDITAYKLARKNVYVNSANLGSAFQRMLSEPKSKQQNSKELHKFVVLNHMLSSYTATLITNLQQINTLIVNDLHIKLIRRSLYTLSEVIKSMKDVELEEIEINIPDSKSFSKSSNESDLLSEQLELVNKLILDLQKLIQNQISTEEITNQSS